MLGVGAHERESDRVARVLREEIMRGVRAPGSRLIERDIAKELSVSRVPVREAIRLLAVEGVVVARPRTWAVVRQLTVRDVRDFAEVREAIEMLVFVFAAERHDGEGLAQLREVLDRQLAATDRDDPSVARAAATDFHRTAVVLSGNAALDELVRVFVTRLRWMFGQHDDLHRVAAEHVLIFDAIAARDGERLRELIRSHLEGEREIAQRRVEQWAAETSDSSVVEDEGNTKG